MKTNPIDSAQEISKREYFAAQALIGIWANPHDVPGKTDGEPVGQAIARVAVMQADALIEALNAKQIIKARPCRSCDGSGLVGVFSGVAYKGNKTCNDCGGTGKIKREAP